MVGGSKNGYKILRDSNVAWGQDLPALSSYMRDNNVGEVVLDYFGQADPAVYGVRYRKFQTEELKRPKDAVYAVSAQNLEGIYWTKDFKPTIIAGSSIFIYDLTKER